ncbi:acyl carrier protein [Actinacidiphila rubida]|uniref:Minimal PKS acyl carrier protein n=1 Tax=Actinacidiphila rubida TaxID=310780 RepID=A0A1H8I075_9ACTN|nr:acyl carrier protein [Actinacidiphila rubida]SEN62140.1 minimal PKS acyl carrier protein [Actinacidiphila rubida]
MNGPVTFDELAALMKARAGLSVDPREMERRPDATFAEFDLDSLGLLGIVAELEKRYGSPLGNEAEGCKNPHAFLENVNNQLTAAGV